jgi:hypothetical protein
MKSFFNFIKKWEEVILLVFPARCTTGDSDFVECRRLCRAPCKRHSVKTALCRAPRQTLSKDLFAEGQARSISNEALCRAPRTRQRRVLGKVLVQLTPMVAVPFAERSPFGTRQMQVLCRVSGMALGKEFFLFFKLCFL